MNKKKPETPGNLGFVEFCSRSPERSFTDLLGPSGFA